MPIAIIRVDPEIIIDKIVFPSSVIWWIDVYNVNAAFMRFFQ